MLVSLKSANNSKYVLFNIINKYEKKKNKVPSYLLSTVHTGVYFAGLLFVYNRLRPT